MALNTAIGWSAGDGTRVLIAAGVTIGVYQVREIENSMNLLGAEIDGFVDAVLTLLDSYETTQYNQTSLNNSSGGKILVKADVLEWEPAAPGTTYGPERELARIAYQLAQLFSSCPVFSGHDMMATQLLRS